MKDSSRKPCASAIYSPFLVPQRTPSFVPRVIFHSIKPSAQSLLIENAKPRFATVKQLATEYAGVFTEGALRNLIWHAEAYARNPSSSNSSNGFLAVIHRPGGLRKVLLDREAFARWLNEGKNAEVCDGKSS